MRARRLLQRPFLRREAGWKRARHRERARESARCQRSNYGRPARPRVRAPCARADGRRPCLQPCVPRPSSGRVSLIPRDRSSSRRTLLPGGKEGPRFYGPRSPSGGRRSSDPGAPRVIGRRHARLYTSAGSSEKACRPRGALEGVGRKDDEPQKASNARVVKRDYSVPKAAVHTARMSYKIQNVLAADTMAELSAEACSVHVCFTHVCASDMPEDCRTYLG